MSASTVYNHIEQMTEAQPIIWWKAGNNYNQTQEHQYSLLIYFRLIFTFCAYSLLSLRETFSTSE